MKLSGWDFYDFTKIPFEDIERVGQRTMLHRDLFTVSWLLGRFCNYSCSYCWPYASTKKVDHRPLTLLIKTMDEIKSQARQRGFNSFHFSFSGGEPTLHPGYLQLLTHYSNDITNSNYQSVHMTSNISPKMSWFKKYIEATKDLHRVSVTASFHREFAARSEFCDKLIFLQENDVQVTINMVMSPSMFEELWEDAIFFHRHSINVTLKPQSDEKASRVVDGYSLDMMKRLQQGLPQKDYTLFRRQSSGRKSTRPQSSFSSSQEESSNPNMQVELTDGEGKAWYVDQAERFNAFGFNKFKGWLCSSGYRSLIIREPDGYIKRSYSCHDKPLGHIEKGFRLFEQPEVCTTPSCVSSADSKIPKKKPGCLLALWKPMNV